MADAARAVAAITERTVAATGYYLSPTSETVVNAGLVRPPATLAVLRLLEQAEKVFRGGDNTGAIPLLRAVLQADSLLPQPRFLLVAALRNVGGKQALEAESLIVSMTSRRSGMLPLDAAFTDIAVAWFASPESEYEAALALGKVDSLANPYLMMLAASRARHPREALRLYGRRDTTTLFSQTWRSWQTVAAQSYHQLGEYQQELELARSARRRDSRGVGYWTAEARALEALGRTDSLERLITESASLERADGTVQVIYGAMLEADYHRRPEAKRLAERVRAALAILPDSFRNATGGRNIERAALRVLGDYRGVIALYDREYSAALGAEGRLLAARYRILLGDTAGVGAIIDAAKSAPLSVYSTWGTIGQPLYYRAQLLAMMGRKDEAVASLREALNRGYRLGVDDELQLFWDNVRNYPPFVELTKLR
jgi:tetratricopeptide (TPR) repeat protein